MVGVSVGVSVGNSLPVLSVGSNVGTIGSAVGSAVGSYEGSTTGLKVGPVGSYVGSSEGVCMGSIVGSSLGSVTGTAVGIEMCLIFSKDSMTESYIAENIVAVANDEFDGSSGMLILASPELTTAFMKHKVELVNFVNIYSLTGSMKVYGASYTD